MRLLCAVFCCKVFFCNVVISTLGVINYLKGEGSRCPEHDPFYICLLPFLPSCIFHSDTPLSRHPHFWTLPILCSVMNRVLKGRQKGVQWRMVERLDDVSSDDICLLAQRWSYMEAKLEKLGRSSKGGGICLLAQRLSNVKAKLEKLEMEAAKVRRI